MVVRDRIELEIRPTFIVSGRTWDAPVPDIVVSGRYKGQCPTRPARFPTLVVTCERSGSSSATNCAMGKWMSLLDSAHQIGLETNIPGSLSDSRLVMLY